MAQRRNDSKRSEADHNEGIPIVKARTMLGELANRAGYGSERIKLTRRGKLIAVLVSKADFDRLESVA